MQNTNKEKIGWYFYDWANSAFTTSVITVFIGPYLTTISRNAADKNGFVNLLGISIYPDSLFGYVISISVILQVFFLPLIGSIVDKHQNKKLLLGIFAYLGATSTILLYFLTGNNFLFGSALLLIGNLSFGASIVVYNSFLNDISHKDERDKVSSIGWAFGYLGAAIVLIFNLFLYSNSEKFGLSEGLAVRISLLSAGVWWALFTIIPLILLKDRKNESDSNKIKLSHSFKQLFLTIKEISKHPKAFYFLIAFLIYNDGVQAVITFAAVFGKEELGLQQSTLITAILIVQIVAFFGALLFNYIAKITNTTKAILISLVIWIFSLIYSYQFLFTENQFFMLATTIAIVLGGTQALSRSLFSRLIPIGKEAEYFGLYEISDKGTSWMGTLVFSLSLQFTHNYRIANLSLIIFFIIGFILLLRFKEDNTII